MCFSETVATEVFTLGKSEKRIASNSYKRTDSRTIQNATAKKSFPKGRATVDEREKELSFTEYVKCALKAMPLISAPISG